MILLNIRGYLTIESTAKMESNNDDTFRNAIIILNNNLIIISVKEAVINSSINYNTVCYLEIMKYR